MRELILNTINEIKSSNDNFNTFDKYTENIKLGNIKYYL